MEDFSELISTLEENQHGKMVTVDGKQYVTKAVFLPPKPDLPALVTTRTLDSVVEFLTTNIDELPAAGLAILVQSPNMVRIVGKLDDTARRPIYLEATCPDYCAVNPLGFRFGQFMDLEPFNISLQSLFVATDSLGAVLKVVGNVKEEEVSEANDDGVTQSVAAKSGVHLVKKVDVPNPVELQPRRTFAEVPQPVCDFTLRVKGRTGSLPQAALFEADGGDWQVQAIKNIKTYLATELGADRGVVKIAILG